MTENILKMELFTVMILKMMMIMMKMMIKGEENMEKTEKNEVMVFEKPKMSVYSDVTLYNEFFKMAQGLAKSDIVPENYRNKPESCLVAIDVARQIGARSPLFVMQNLYVVKGKPAWSGQYCDALVRANYTDVKSPITGTGMDRGCQVTGYDKNGNFCEGVRVTIKMAHDEGWYNKTGSKWQTMPDLMLQYRAFAFFARVHCPEKLLGIHDEYENVDMEIEKQVVVNPFEAVQTPVEDDVVTIEPIEVPKADEFKCEMCGVEISQKVHDYSVDKHGKPLCYICQKKVKFND